jgi:enamine deaminase RidA (YjgF/YER057c/UK114 family)
VHNLQFQDRTSQCLSHVSRTLEVLGESLGELQGLTRRTGLVGAADPDAATRSRILSRHTLAEVRARFAAELGASPGEAAVELGAAVELF